MMYWNHRELNYIRSVRDDPHKIEISCAIPVLAYLPQNTRSML